MGFQLLSVIFPTSAAQNWGALILMNSDLNQDFPVANVPRPT